MAISKGGGANPKQVIFTDNAGVQRNCNEVWYRKSASDEYLKVWPESSGYFYIKTFPAEGVKYNEYYPDYTRKLILEDVASIDWYSINIRPENDNYYLKEQKLEIYDSNGHLVSTSVAGSYIFTGKLAGNNGRYEFSGKAEYIGPHYYRSIKGDNCTITPGKTDGEAVPLTSTLTLTCTPDPGYSFNKWYLYETDENGKKVKSMNYLQPTWNVTITQNHSYQFTAYTQLATVAYVTVKSDNTTMGSVLPELNRVEYELSSKQYTVNAKPASGYTFDHWTYYTPNGGPYTDNRATLPVVFDVGGNYTYTATFIKQPVWGGCQVYAEWLDLGPNIWRTSDFTNKTITLNFTKGIHYDPRVKFKMNSGGDLPAKVVLKVNGVEKSTSWFYPGNSVILYQDYNIYNCKTFSSSIIRSGDTVTVTVNIK